MVAAKYIKSHYQFIKTMALSLGVKDQSTIVAGRKKTDVDNDFDFDNDFEAKCVGKQVLWKCLRSSPVVQLVPVWGH